MAVSKHAGWHASLQGVIQACTVPPRHAWHPPSVQSAISKHSERHPSMQGGIQAYSAPSKRAGCRPSMQGAIQACRAACKQPRCSHLFPSFWVIHVCAQLQCQYWVIQQIACWVHLHVGSLQLWRSLNAILYDAILWSKAGLNFIVPIKSIKLNKSRAHFQCVQFASRTWSIQSCTTKHTWTLDLFWNSAPGEGVKWQTDKQSK